ncbi:methylated-DNA--[protein]-cysteine S-methyltransferase [Glycomyces sp. L485]|uniref:methylated-DNA--[protein]-cysteine S-methyltransferase n=1 Tax=Glycomyces sp. L485 TaxID=2909235 RepID=UPI001F4B0C7A|nr:methylated-DNA--[protein]-cysteine S-methyltransferase [Glycomyces sp. L485]MCH7231507.1 methylated-DNA--[protein]-cysteine S-methyltransferase [Glycomyces sp. L485]
MSANVNGAKHLTMDSPLGLIAVSAVEEGLTHVHMGVEEVKGAWGPEEPTPVLEAALEQLEAYFAGALTEFDLPLAAGGTDFQCRVWAALRTVPYGVTVSYGDIAREVGNPAAVRAVGLANGSNPIGIVVPCHRVIGANGKLTGYAGGVWRKEWLLALERGEQSLFAV